MSMYNKIFTKILDSSVWLEPTATRIVWITLIAAMDENGFCPFAAVGNVAGRARVTEEEARTALAQLEAPDPESSDPENEGRRIERVPGGWIVLNAPKYRALVTRVNIQEKVRERVRRHREKKRFGNAHVTLSNDSVMQSESESESETKEQIPSPRKKPSAHSETLYKLYPRHVGKKKALAAIDKALREKSFDDLLLAVQAFCRKCAREGKEEQFIPHPATWFAQGRYEDEEFKPEYQIQKQGASNGKGHSNLAALREALGPDSDGLDTDGDVEGSAGRRAYPQALFKETGQ